MFVNNSAVFFLQIKSALKLSTISISSTSFKSPPLSSIKSRIKLIGNSSGKLFILTRTASYCLVSLSEPLSYVMVSFILLLR